MAIKEKSKVKDEINDWLKTNERTLGYLATKTGYSYDTLYSIFVMDSFELSDKRLEKINKVLGTKFKK